MNSNALENSCKNCGGKFKVATSEYIIRSRHSEKNETTIENLDMLQCTICGNMEMTQSSQIYIDIIRKKIRNEMEKKINKEYKEEKKEMIDEAQLDNPLKNLKSFFKNIIG